MNTSYLNQLKNEIVNFELKIDQFISDLEINIDDLEIDHVGVRTETTQAAQNLLEELTKNTTNKILAHVVFKNRPIYSIKLNDPVLIRNQRVDVLELAYPDSSDHHSQPVAWEHIEIVV